MALRANLNPEPLMLSAADDAGMLDWSSVFGNDRPVELEIGAGKGTFLLAASEARPETNFIGIEYSKAYCDFAADRLRRHARHNCRMVHGEASWFIRKHVPDSSLSVVHVYFPDPWPKNRQQKRRLIQPLFLVEIARGLKPGGQLRLVTDHAGYFAHMQEVLRGQQLLREIPFPGGGAVQSESDTLLVGTNFERKYIAEGRTFHAVAAEKPLLGGA